MQIFTTASRLIFAGALLVLVGCGGGDSPQPATETATPEPAAPSVEGTVPAQMQAFSDDGDVFEIVIEGDDMMRFDVEQFSVSPGQMVRLTLNHVGSLPAQAMGHNVVIIYPDDDIFDFGGDVGEAGGGLHDDYVPESLRDRVVAFTEIIGGGETTVVEFQAPSEPGEYPYLCSFPGHFGQMNGIMTVE